MITYRCGCKNDVHEPSGILHCVYKCKRHQRQYRDPARLDAAYYAELINVNRNEIIGSRHVEEMQDALGDFPAPTTHVGCLEIGCGCSPYAGALKEAGWRYIGLDPSRWAAEWTAKRYGVITCTEPWEWWSAYPSCGLVLAAHVLEHLADAPAGLQKMYDVLMPGGELWLLVPDDSDPVNPDHLFFFTADTLQCCLEKVGFQIQRIAVRKIVERENFIYARAKKPG